MTLTTDNPTLNKAIKEFSAATKATDNALKAFDFEAVDKLEEIEAQKETAFFKLIFEMMPAKQSKQMQEPRHIMQFKAKVIDKYILD